VRRSRHEPERTGQRRRDAPHRQRSRTARTGWIESESRANGAPAKPAKARMQPTPTVPSHERRSVRERARAGLGTPLPRQLPADRARRTGGGGAAARDGVARSRRACRRRCAGARARADGNREALRDFLVGETRAASAATSCSRGVSGSGAPRAPAGSGGSASMRPRCSSARLPARRAAACAPSSRCWLAARRNHSAASGASPMPAKRCAARSSSAPRPLASASPLCASAAA